MQLTPMDLGTARHREYCGLKSQQDLRLVSRLRRPGVGSWPHSPTGDLGESLAPLSFTSQGVRTRACRPPGSAAQLPAVRCRVPGTRFLKCNFHSSPPAECTAEV